MLQLMAEGDRVEVGLNLCGERESYFEKQHRGAQSLLSGLRQHQSAGVFLQAQPVVRNRMVLSQVGRGQPGK